MKLTWKKHAVDLRSQISINEDEKTKFLRAREAELEGKLRIAEKENKRRAANETFLQRQANDIRSQLSIHEDVELRSPQASFAADQENEVQLVQRGSPKLSLYCTILTYEDTVSVSI